MIMNQIIVGMGEALWDVLPEGKKIGGARQTSLIMYHNSVLTARWSVRLAMTNWVMRYLRILMVRN